MRYLLLFILVSISLIAGLTGCENCGPSAEPITTLYINTSTSVRLDTVFSPGSLQPISTQPYSTTGSKSYRRLILPINLTADSTQYVFRLDGRQDTVTVFYQRKTAYRNRSCGYVLELYPPLKAETVRASRGQVSNVSYIQNKDRKVFADPLDTGIQLSLQL